MKKKKYLSEYHQYISLMLESSLNRENGVVQGMVRLIEI